MFYSLFILFQYTGQAMGKQCKAGFDFYLDMFYITENSVKQLHCM